MPHPQEDIKKAIGELSYMMAEHNVAVHGGKYKNSDMPAYSLWVAAIREAFKDVMTFEESQKIKDNWTKGAVISLISRGACTADEIIAIAVLCFNNNPER